MAQRIDQPVDYAGPKLRNTGEQGVRPIFWIFTAIIAMVCLLGIALPLCIGQPSTPYHPTRASLDMLKQALNNFEVDHDRFPTTAEGLDALVHRPPGMPDWHPRLEKIPLDAWGHPFVYRKPTTTGQQFYDLYSLGPDGQDATPDDIWE